MRKPISKKLRFEIFKRDAFCCQYCGKTPPSVVLEIDHIVPVIKGGANVIDNLISACFDCNRGKGKNELNSLPSSTEDKIAVLKEKESQYKAYQKILKKISNRIDDEVYQVDRIFNSYFTTRALSDGFKNGSVKKFISELGFDTVSDAMHSSCSKFNNDTSATKYFCGICWNKIKDNG